MSVSLDPPPPDQSMDLDRPTSEDGPATGQSQSSASTPADAADPMSSLRAAALLTLRSKRRTKPSGSDSGQPLPTPSRLDTAVPSSVQLDYGNEDTSATLSVTPASSTTKPRRPHRSEDEEDQIREEGEISDSETHSPAPPASQSTLPSLTKPAQPPSQPTSQVTPVIPPAQPPTKATPPPISASLPKKPSIEELVTDATHVRPGLAMTQAQYSTVQDIILDLLGWGVPPEYLVDYGVSREVVFHVFTDLNLRLPSNLDTKGLVPFLPPHLSATPETLPPKPPTEIIPHTPTAPREPPREPRRASVGHPSLPPKPSAPQGTLSTRPHPQTSSALSAGAPPFVPSPPAKFPDAMLQDMEQQRRRELLARKAALASRKPKPDVTPSAASIPREVIDVDVDMDAPSSALAPTDTVDDFLKTIAEADSTHGDGDLSATSIHSVIEVMDVDDASTQPSTPIHSTSKSSSVGPEVTMTGDQRNPEEPPSRAASSHFFGDSYGNDDDSPILSSGIPALARASSSTSLHRRGTKRPVAADFVDLEPGPRARNGHGRYDDGYGGGSGPALRKAGSFAGVSGMRRCVIDLSDDDTDGEGDVLAFSLLPANGRAVYTPSPRLPPAVPKSASSLGLSPRITTSSPMALVEKEQEIKRMRELIAHREAKRRVKQHSGTQSAPISLVHSPTVPTLAVPLESPISGEDPAIVKQEDREASLSTLDDADPALGRASGGPAGNSDAHEPLARLDPPAQPEITESPPPPGLSPPDYLQASVPGSRDEAAARITLAILV